MRARPRLWNPLLRALGRWRSDEPRRDALSRVLNLKPPVNLGSDPKLTLSGEFLDLKDARAAADLMLDPRLSLSPARRLALAQRFLSVPPPLCLHRHGEILPFLADVLALPKGVPGVIIEAGVCRGGGTAKISLAAAAAGRTLLACDSFTGLPEAAGDRYTLTGRAFRWKRGDFRASLAEARETVRRYGAPAACRFVPGLFERTLPLLRGPVAAVFLDVDLVSSTRACLRALYPRLSLGGVLYSQDAHFAKVARLLRDARFWRRELGVRPPVLEPLGPTLVRLRRR